MSDWATYIKEREGHEVLETEDGFVEYHLAPGEPPLCILDSFFVRPELRKSAVGNKEAGLRLTSVVEAFAREHGCNHVIATVYPGMLNATQSLRASLAYGMSLHAAEQGRIILVKYVGGV
jgi:hypothetical protein